MRKTKPAGSGKPGRRTTPNVTKASSSPPGAPWGPQPRLQGDASKTLAGQTAQRLRRDIISNQLPAGERLTFEKLSRRYDVGSSPLREALFQVMGEGFVRTEEHRGFIVAPIIVGEMLDISSLRANLEAQALRLSIERGDIEWETRVLAANHRLKKALPRLHSADAADRAQAENEWEQRHRDVHYALCSACGSPWLLHFIDTLFDHLERYRRHFWQYSDRASGADDQHERISNAALARDSALAVSLLEAHFRTQAELSLLAKSFAEAA